MKNADYIYAVASIRVKEKTLLSDTDIQTLVGMKDKKDILQFIKEKGWGSDSSENDIDKVFSAEETKVNNILDSLKVDEAIIDVLSYDKKYHNLKTAVKEVCTGNEDMKAFYSIEDLSGEMLLKVLKENDYEKLPEHMRQVAVKAKDLMLTTRDGQRLDIMVDRACLDATEAVAKTSKDKFISDYAESKVAMADIKIAVRAASTKRKRSFLEEALAPCQSFDVSKLADAAAESPEAVYSFLEKKGYGEAVNAIKESYSSFEKWCDDHIMSGLMGEKHNTMGSGPVVAYYLARQNEIRTVRIIVTAKENGFPEETIRERVRKMYG
jgi:V/A-type H+-transporting ATPase subunit C